MDIRERVRLQAEALAGIGSPAIMENFLLRNGTVFSGHACGGERLTPKECFKNATWATGDGDYCEGFGWRKDLPILVHHAWRVKDGLVIDRTWDRPEECQYLGVVFTQRQLMAELRRNKVYGLLDIGMYNIRLMLKVDPGMAELLPAQLKRKFQKV